MAFQVFCNVCLCEPHKPTPRFSLTSCGHVICEICLQKGKKDECLICRTPCRTIFLSKQLLAGCKSTFHYTITICQREPYSLQTSPDIQSLFMGIDTLCKKYAKEITQVAEFQEKHRKHLLAYHRQRTMKLEESLKEVTQQLHQMQCMKPPEQTPQLPLSSTSRNPHSIASRKQNGYSSYSLHPSHPSTSEIMEPMEIDPVPSPMRKPDTPTGPTRLSLITPPRDGRMGSVSYRSSQSSGIMSSQNSRAGTTRSTPIRLPHSGCSATSSSGSQSSRRGSWAPPEFRTPQLYTFTSPSPQPSVTRQPITIPGLLQRQHLGSTNFGGHSTQR